ncbi:MAG TPA: CHAD domain-containing protein [Candidatus Limnocylindrales bacterium]|jgi:CHAD domain-containing protein|nr:CHAD domain-containing protein [Candidatus Limnocylindrales bacterium]
MTEVELKYRVGDLAAAERLLGAERIGPFTATASGARSTQLEDRYVDTADGALTRAGFAVRLRQSGGETIVSVKSLAHGDGPGGAMRREELEGPADRVAPAADWPASDARALVLEHGGDAPLVERVTIRQLRRVRKLRSTAARVDLSLDEVDVVARGRVVDRFVELEAELTKGDEQELAALGAALEAEPTLERARSSKLEAALAALDGDAIVDAEDTARPDEPRAGAGSDEPARTRAANTPAPSAPTEGIEPGVASSGPRLVVGTTPGVTAADHIAEAGRKVLRFHLARMLDRESGTRSGIDAEDVHKMRVATRRQRAAWRVFGSAFRGRRTRRYRDGLREIARRLGAVRDLDVQLEAADAYRADLPTVEQRALEPLLAAWRVHRDEARVLLIRELDSSAYRRFIDDYVDFVRTEGAAVAPVGPVEPHHVRDTAPSRIWSAYEHVRGYEPVLRWADVETLHELRIAGKWLRYSLEFVREALGPEADPLIARVTALQDHLGLMNDADVTASMTRTFLVEQAGSLSEVESAAIGRYLVDREREVGRLRRTIGSPWRALAGPAYRRALGRVVAGL